MQKLFLLALAQYKMKAEFSLSRHYNYAAEIPWRGVKKKKNQENNNVSGFSFWNKHLVADASRQDSVGNSSN